MERALAAVVWSLCSRGGLEISAIVRTFRIGVRALILNFMTIFPSLATRCSSSAPAHPTHLSPLVLRALPPPRQDRKWL